MRIGGFQKFSLIDYPGKICAVVFTQGCNFRCSYCHNPALVDRRLFQKTIPASEIISFLERRKGALEAATVTGGEPLLQEGVFPFLESVKKLGYLVKLDTNGSFPERLERIVKEKLADYIAMDVKTSLEKYAGVSGVDVNRENIKKSIDIIMCSGLDYQFRTTIGKSFLNFEDIKHICGLIKGARAYVLQKFVPVRGPEVCSSPDGAEYGEAEIRQFQELAVGLIRE